MTKIHFERSGGFMGRTVSMDLDLDNLPEEQAKALRDILDEVDFFGLPKDMTDQPVPDGFTYTITVNKGFFRKHSIRVSDANAPEDLLPLLEELSQQARGR